MEKLMLRPNEAAELIGCSRALVYRMLRSREIPFTRVGKCMKIPAQALTEWAKRHTEAALSGSPVVGPIAIPAPLKKITKARRSGK